MADTSCLDFYHFKKLQPKISREEHFKNFDQSEYDLVIIGGGSAGLGSALDATTRGLKTLLVEADDFASETSSKSTKLLHGGVRYLEQLWTKLLTQREWDQTLYNLIRDALKERKTVIANAPNLAQPLALLTPIYSWPEVPYYWAGLKVYDLFAGKKGKLPNSHFLSADKIKKLYPQINSKGLRGGVVYYDGQFNDSRLAIGLAKTATAKGAILLNHTRVVGFEKDGEKIVGVQIKDMITGEIHSVRSKIVLNATGPFADKLRQMDDPSVPAMISGASGTHLVLDKQFALPDTGILIPKTSDGRVLFVLPWEGKTLIGTTDSKSEVVEKPKTTEEDITYLIKEVGQYLSQPITRADVKSYWTGIRPLVSDPNASDTAALARDHVINRNSKSGLITLTGGKWTTYRVMGEHAIDQVLVQLGRDPKIEPSKTDQLQLSESVNWSSENYKILMNDYKLPSDIAIYLNRIYAGEAKNLLNTYPLSHQRMADGLPFIWAEIYYAVHVESARSITDVLARRVRMATMDKNETKRVLDRVGKVLARELGWSEEKLIDELKKARAEFQI
tara:strand:- start:97569 stop:99251 length:1683 start_codon:yes stop_codon:yes gene_type:complete